MTDSTQSPSELLREAREELQAEYEDGCRNCLADCSSANPPPIFCPPAYQRKLIDRIDTYLTQQASNERVMGKDTDDSALVDAINSAVATLAAIRATATGDDWDGAQTARHFHDLCGQEIVALNTALTALRTRESDTPADGERDALVRELQALFTQASDGILETAEVTKTDEWLECPCCEGQGEIQGNTYINLDGLALGVQFFGIGKHFGAHQRLWTFIVKNRDRILTALKAQEDGS